MEPPAKRNPKPWMIAAAVIVLCCCCVALAIGGYAFRINRIRSIPQPPSQDIMPFPKNNPRSPNLESFDIGEAPEGGWENDSLRNEPWNVVTACAQRQGCDQPLRGGHNYRGPAGAVGWNLGGEVDGRLCKW